MIKLNNFYIGESVSFMRKNIPDDFVDLTVTSPPYDDLRNYKGYIFDFESIAKELYRVTKNGGVLVWVVGDSVKDGNESGNSFKQALYFKSIGFKLFDTMIYHKYGSPMRGSLKGYNQTFEYMFVLTKGKIKTTNIIRDRKNKSSGSVRYTTNRRKNGKVNNQGLCKTEKYGRRENIWSYTNGYMQTAKDKIAFNHPALFPEKLAEDHIISWSNEGDIVLDPMCGAGTTCKMAWLNNRKFIGIDMSEEYINDICIPRLNTYGWNEKTI